MTRRVRRGQGVVLTAALAVATVIGLMPAATATSSPGSLQTALQPVAKLLTDTVPAVVATATKLGGLTQSTPLTVIAPLTLDHQSQLTEYLASEYAPSSPSFHKFLSPTGFASYFGATMAHVNAVTRVLHGLGFSVAPVAANRLYVEFTGPVGLLEQTFSTVIDRLRLPGALSTFTANITNLTLPTSLSGLVSGLVGLNSLDVPHTNLSFPTAAARTEAKTLPTLPETGLDGGSAPCVAAIAGAGYTAPQLAKAYNFNGLYAQGFLGQGMTASLVEFDDYHDSNVDTMQRCYGDKGTAVNRVLVDGGTGGPPGPGETEDMADITTMLEMLPQLANLDVYVAPVTSTAELDLYNAFVTNDDSPVLSSSWGNCEENDSQSDARLFNLEAEEAAAQGQQIFDAAGDSGAVDCRGTPDPTGDSISVETEAASPFITGVGGTDLGQRTALGLGHDEDTWNDAGAGGGGQSTYWTMPTWQAGLPSATHAPGASGAACGAPAGTLCREVPDLSADADPDFGMQSDTKFQFSDDIGSLGYSIYCDTPNCALLDNLSGLLPIGLPIALPPVPPLPLGLGGWEPIGGTSLATPLTASAALLWDQDAQSKGLIGLGFLNPALYAVAGNPADYARDFFDITSDSNNAQYDASDCPPGCNTNRLYSATPGYDMASGLGSYNAANLGADLVTQATRLSVTPSTLTMYGDTGGPSTTQPVVVSSGFNGAPYTVQTSAPWLHATDGTIGRTLSWSVGPTGLSPGTYTGTITISGHSSSAVLSVTYEVTPPATLAVSPGALSFSEAAVTAKGTVTTATCNSSLWQDELVSSVGGTTPTRSEVAPSLQALHITNSGPPGSVLHWSAFFFSQTSAWLSQDLDPVGTTVAQTATQPIVNTQGTQAAGTTGVLSLASIANGNVVGGFPDMNQGTYHGTVVVDDLADPAQVLKVPATLVLGNGSHTPMVLAAPTSLAITVKSGSIGTTQLVLSDASKACGYAYSTQSSVPWAIIDPSSYSGAVGSGNATSTVPIQIDASGLSPGTYHGTITVQSQNAEPNPATVPLSLTVTP